MKENCEHATDDVMENRQNPSFFDESSKSLSVWHVVPILELFSFCSATQGLGSIFSISTLLEHRMTLPAKFC